MCDSYSSNYIPLILKFFLFLVWKFEISNSSYFIAQNSKVFAHKIDYARIELKNREFNRVNRFLTDRSLLFAKKKVFSILFSDFYLNLAIANANTLLIEDETTNANNAKNNETAVKPAATSTPVVDKQHVVRL